MSLFLIFANINKTLISKRVLKMCLKIIMAIEMLIKSSFYLFKIIYTMLYSQKNSISLLLYQNLNYI